MQRSSTFGIWLLIQACSGDYAQEYAGKYAHQHIEKYTKDYTSLGSAVEREYARTYEGRYAGNHSRFERALAAAGAASARGPPSPAQGTGVQALAAAAPERQRATSGDAAKQRQAGEQRREARELGAAAFAAERDASDRAESKIAELERLESQLNSDLQNESRATDMAHSILARVHEGFHARQEQLQQSFDAKMRALNPAALVKASARDAEDAVRAAEGAAAALRRLGHEESRARRAELEQQMRRQMASAHALQHEASEAAQQAKSSGFAAARAQREAGVEERVYESNEGRSERASERLQNRAEEVAQRCEYLVERQFGKVEGRLDELADALQDAAQDESDARERALHGAERLAVEARAAAQEAAGSEAKAAPASGGGPQSRGLEGAAASAGGSTLQHQQGVWFQALADAGPVPAPRPATEGPAMEKEGQRGTAEQSGAAQKPGAAAFAAEREASDHAVARIAELESWAAKLQSDLRNGSHTVDMAHSLVATVHERFRTRREQLQQSFRAMLRALNPSVLANATTHDAEGAVRAVEGAAAALRQLDREEAAAMRAELDQRMRGLMAKARNLQQEAFEAAQQAKRSGFAAARAQREAGVEERVYESNEGRSEQASERLQDRAEEVAQRCEYLVERQFGEAEGRLGELADALQDSAQDESRAREGSLRSAERRVMEARAAAQEAAAAAALGGGARSQGSNARDQQNVGPEAPGPVRAPRWAGEGRAAGDQTTKGAAAAFLARASARGPSSGPGAPLVCAAAAVALAVFAGSRALGHGWRTVAVERPALG